VSTSYESLRSQWQPVIGMETHVELGTRTKMFCGCEVDHHLAAEPNTRVCHVCLGMPGAMPSVNAEAVRMTVAIGLALHCEIAPWCRFARKNYFYPDMPKNYQISQYDEPLCFDGWLDVVDPESGETVRVGIERVHMEEDTGKSQHQGSGDGRIHGSSHSLVDFNRAGVPLVEIVTRPDIRSAAVAKAYVGELREVLRGLGVTEARMDRGQLRCDTNTSIRPVGTDALGTRTETKNVNSLRSVERAVESEVVRQAALLSAGQKVKQETRHFHETDGSTSPGRSKEEATDYRYFPEPDLVPIALGLDYVAKVRATLPEEPAARRAKLKDELGLDDLALRQMTDAGALELVLDTIGAGASPDTARKLWMNELAGRANELGVELAEVGVSARQVARVAALLDDGTLTARLAREVLAGVAAGEGEPDAVIQGRGLSQVSDSGELERLVDEAIAANPEAARSVRDGRVGAAGQIVGGVMKASGGKANAAAVRELVLARLGS
jgi:aspartyl-tRNA(Asn)/glutamyl-tRNA(Gln) amidotransferase subunit B